MENTKPYSSKEAQEASKWFRNLDHLDRVRIINEYKKGVYQPKGYPEKREGFPHNDHIKVQQFLKKKHNIDNLQDLLEGFLIAKKNGEPFEL